MGKGTNFSGCAHQGFFDYFIADISDGSIRHGDNSDYSSGTVVVWKAFGENLFNQRNGIHTLSNSFHVCRCQSEGVEVFWFSYLSFTDDKEGLFNQP